MSDGTATNSATATGQICDLPRLLDRFGGDRDFIGELMSLFKETTANLVGDLRTAAQRNDMELGRRQAHTIKGAAGNVAADRLAQAAAEAEQNARSGDFPHFKAAVDAVCREFALLSESVTWGSTPHPTH